MNGAAGKRRTIIKYHKGYSKHRGWSALVSKVLKTILDLTLVLLPTSFGKLRWKILTTKRLERRAVKRFRNVLIQHNCIVQIYSSNIIRNTNRKFHGV